MITYRKVTSPAGFFISQDRPPPKEENAPSNKGRTGVSTIRYEYAPLPAKENLHAGAAAVDQGVGHPDAAPINQGNGGWLLATEHAAAKSVRACRQSRAMSSIISTERNDAAKHAPNTRLSDELTIQEGENGEQRLSQVR